MKWKVALFSWILLILILVLQTSTALAFLTPIDAWDYIARTTALEGFNMTLFTSISFLLVFQYFEAANMIYQFSITGVLPTKRDRLCHRIILVIVGCLIIFGGIAMSILIYFELEDDLIDDTKISYLVAMWLCFIFLVLVVVLFVLTVDRLRRSRAQAKVPG